MNHLPPDARPAVLILGANGRLGCAAAQAFDAAGWRVLAQVRRDASSQLPSRATLLRTPLSDTDEIVRQAHGARVVVHAINPLYTAWDREAMPALEAGLQVAERLGAHFMLPGNVYNFGESMPALLSEETPFRPSTRKGEIRVQMEALIARRVDEARAPFVATTPLSPTTRTSPTLPTKAASSTKPISPITNVTDRRSFTASVVRAGDFFGAGTGTWLDLAITKSLSAGKLVYPGPLDVPHAWAYLPDLARAFVRVASIERPAPFDVWHFEGHTATGREFLDAIEAVVHESGSGLARRPLRRGRFPWPLIRAGGLVIPMWRELARMSYLWRTPHGLDGRRLAALAAGSPPSTSLHQALREALGPLAFHAEAVQRAAAVR